LGVGDFMKRKGIDPFALREPEVDLDYEMDFMKIQIKPGLEIGDNCKPFIIAEVGSNWTCFTDAKDSITKAKQCGADAVKFQLFNDDALYGFKRSADGPITLKNLPLDWIPRLKEKADACGIEFMCSAFSPQLIDAVDPYVNIHKVASAELTHVRMLEKLRRIGKPVILSTGASVEGDIRQALYVLQDDHYAFRVPSCPAILMYCVSAYPALEINLDAIPLIRSTFNVLSGFSDHSTNVAPIPEYAVKCGASVIEKHFSIIDADTPDRPHSLNPIQFKRMVDYIRGNIQPVLGPTAEERGMILRHNRRIVATRDIAPGGTFKEGENFGIYRVLSDDSHGFSPWMVNDIIGRVALRSVKVGQAIGPGDVLNV
jgi:sialic acid synthase SpsE